MKIVIVINELSLVNARINYKFMCLCLLTKKLASERAKISAGIVKWIIEATVPHAGIELALKEYALNGSRIRLKGVIGFKVIIHVNTQTWCY